MSQYVIQKKTECDRCDGTGYNISCMSPEQIAFIKSMAVQAQGVFIPVPDGMDTEFLTFHCRYCDSGYTFENVDFLEVLKKLTASGDTGLYPVIPDNSFIDE